MMNLKEEKYVNDTIFTHFAEHFNEIVQYNEALLRFADN